MMSTLIIISTMTFFGSVTGIFFPKVDYDFLIRVFYVAAQAKRHICASMDGIITIIIIRP